MTQTCKNKAGQLVPAPKVHHVVVVRHNAPGFWHPEEHAALTPWAMQRNENGTQGRTGVSDDADYCSIIIGFTPSEIDPLMFETVPVRSMYFVYPLGGVYGAVVHTPLLQV